jgi:hypothetical protein
MPPIQPKTNVLGYANVTYLLLKACFKITKPIFNSFATTPFKKALEGLFKFTDTAIQQPVNRYNETFINTPTFPVIESSNTNNYENTKFWCYKAFPLPYLKKIISFCFFVFFIHLAINSKAQLPTNLLPLNGATVTDPISFSWLPVNNNNDIYLNVSTSPTIATIDVLNWHDDGTHYFTRTSSLGIKGQKLYWRVSTQGVFSPIRSFTIGDISIDPYYNTMNMAWPANQYWQPTDTTTMTLASLLDIKNSVGGVGTSPDRKLGFSAVVPLFYTSIEQNKNVITRLTHLAEQTDMPILFTIDGFEFMNSVPELWNWYEPTKPGFDLSNKKNVEAFDWGNTNYVKEGTRNWGFPFNVGFPHPNLASPIIINETINKIYQLCNLINNWFVGLPNNKKYLFAGIKVGWEVQIGTNYYYPAGANTTTPDLGKQVGFAAVKTLGLANSGSISSNQLTSVIQNYFTKLASAAQSSGLPRSKIYTHSGGFDAAPNPIVYANVNSSFAAGANPGWSFYTYNLGPNGLSGLNSSFSNKNWKTWWGNTEWGGVISIVCCSLKIFIIIN